MMTILYALLPVLLVSAAGTVQEDYDIEEQFDASTTTSADLEAFPIWLEEEEDTEVSIPERNLCPLIPSLETRIPELCNQTTCSHNGNCSNNNENETLICCFNGCVRTCMHPLDPPVAFDWIEESPEIIKIITPEKSQSAHSSPPEMMALPGGCVLSPTQLSNLQAFEENQHVSECFCNIGNVLCKISER